jgi:hypothetical protein
VPWLDYVARITENQSAAGIGKRIGLAASSVTRWSDDNPPKPANISKFCRAYGRPVFEGMVAAGYIPSEEIASAFVEDPSRLSDEELGRAIEALGQEVKRRGRR